MSTENPTDLDRVLSEIRAEEPPRDAMEAAVARVRTALADAPAAPAEPGSSTIDRCAGFRALIPAYLSGDLARDAALLLDDHVKECVPCRRALMAARAPRSAVAAARPAGAGNARRRAWLLPAAAVLLVAAAVSFSWLVLGGRAPERLQVLAVDGDLYRVGASTTERLLAGAVLAEDRPLRSGRGSSAVLCMADGTRIELRERTELHVARRRDGATIVLAGGGIIVEAAHQGPRRLEVRTEDCLATVKGTIFTVASGTLGSRVSVIEGSVQVATGGNRLLLHPGEQATSEPGLSPVPVMETIAWSRDAARYAEILRGIRDLRRDLAESIPTPALRHDTRLLDLAPDGTVVFVGIPNLSDALSRASVLIRKHLEENEALRSWWNERVKEPGAERSIEEALAKASRLGAHLGDEIALSLVLSPEGTLRGPVVMAEVKDADTFRTVLRTELEEIPKDLSVTVDGGLLVIQPSADVGSRTGSGAFATSAFHDRVAEAYRDGASWVFAADLRTILAKLPHPPEAGGAPARESATLASLGLLDAGDLVVEVEEHDRRTHRSATLSFDRERRGLASLLASPAPMRAVDYVSPDAALAVAAVVRDPGTLAREIVDGLAAAHPDLPAELARIHVELGVDPVADLAGSLEGDVAVAIDGPLLPVPAWKAVVEVRDPARLQHGIESIVERVAARARENGLAAVPEIERTEASGRTYYTLRNLGSAVSMTYTYSDGFLIVAPDRSVVDRAIEQESIGYTLTGSPRFRELLPQGASLDFSGIAWQNLGPSLGPLESLLRTAGNGPAASALASSAADSTPRLGVAWAAPDRIVLASDAEGGLGADLASFVGLEKLALLRAIAAGRLAVPPDPSAGTPPR